MSTIAQEFIEQSISVIEKKNTPKIIKCLDQLTEEQIWMRPNKASNSIGNILLHLCGNIRQYVISALGDQPDIRERDKEFSAQGGYTKEELLVKLNDTLTQAINVMRNTDEVRLMKIHSVQGFNYSGIGIIVHITEHYSHHTGQIIFWTKQLTGNDLGFYSHIDLNKKNKN
ncbi:MAG TPA: DinB family protein [Chitinophagaceae bacterium]|nr:DinB family protein [Chitinophagaceae bacterium]